MLTSWLSSHVVGWLLAATMTTTAAAKANRTQKVLTNITGFLFFLCLQVAPKISASLTLSFFSIAQPETTFRQKLSVGNFFLSKSHILAKNIDTTKIEKNMSPYYLVATASLFIKIEVKSQKLGSHQLKHKSLASKSSSLA